MKVKRPTMAEPTQSIGARMARGAAWMVALRSADRVLGFVSMLILARLLVPADFGLVAIGMAIVGGLAVFSEFSFDLALIQNQSAERRHYDTAWTFGLLRGLLLAGLLLLLAQPAATLFNDARMAELVSVMAIFPFLQGFTNVGVVDFRKELVFHKEFVYRFSSRLVGVITTICFAFLWQDYWALVVGQLVTRVMRVTLSYGLHPYRPRLSLAAWKELFHFSKWLLLNSIVLFFSKRAGVFVVGAFMTTTSVGIITLSTEITGLVSQAFVAPIKQTFFPGFAKISHDLPALRELFLKAYSLVVLIAAPATIGVGMTADLLVPLALGVNWLETIPIIEILVIAALSVALQGPVRPILLALNRPKIVTYLAMIRTALLIPSLIVGTWLGGLAGAAWATVGTRLIVMAVEYFILWRVLGLSLITLLVRVWRVLASSSVMAASVWALKQHMALSTDAGLAELSQNLAIVVPCGVFAYGASLLTLWTLSRRPENSAEAVIVTFVHQSLFRKR